MNICICKDAHTYIWGQHIPYNAWYGQDETGWWFCTVHGVSEDNTLTLRRYNGTRWVEVQENSRTTQNICAWATHRGLWWTKVHWFKDEDKQKSLVAKQIIKHDSYMNHYQNLMKHDRKHKKSGGIRLDKENFYANKIFTDYECSNNPVHDFKQYYN